MRHFMDNLNPTQCISNNATTSSPCAFGLWPGGGWAIQVVNVPTDILNNGIRRMTLGFVPPMSHFDFSNWILGADGQWGLFTDNPIQQHPIIGRGNGLDWYAMKVPPTPPSDGMERSQFVNVPIQFQGVAGDSVIIAFGYAENGDPKNLYCTSRQETCYTTTAATLTNPFVFASETQNPQSCSSGCTVNIPAIPGRILYYQPIRINGAQRTYDALKSQEVQ